MATSLTSPSVKWHPAGFSSSQSSGFPLMKNCHVHMQIHLHMTTIWTCCISVTSLPRMSICLRAQLKICTSKSLSCFAFTREVKVRSHKETEELETGWYCLYWWEGKGVEEPEQPEKPNHGNVSLALQRHRISRCYYWNNSSRMAVRTSAHRGRPNFRSFPHTDR